MGALSAVLLHLYLLLIVLSGLPGAANATTSCEATSDTCAGAHFSLFAIAHDYNDPTNYVLYRVRVQEQPTGTSWGDGINGSFYRVSLDGVTAWQAWTPFNGIGSDASGNPTMRPFSFIVKAPKSATGMLVELCASNYTGNAQNPSEPVCETNPALWTDTFDGLPAPAVGASQAEGVNLELLNASVQVHSNGVYGAPITVEPQSVQLTEAQATWLYDHLVFLDANSNVYTNDVLADSVAAPSFAALSIEEAAFQTTPTSKEYRVKFAKIHDPVQPVDPSASPDRQFWVYSSNSSNANTGKAIQVTLGLLYDASADCPGALSSDTNSKASTCSPMTGPAADVATGDPLSVTVLDGSGMTFAAQASQTAGASFDRTLSLSVEDPGVLCTAPVNPLAISTGSAQNLPNYVIDTQTASTDGWPSTFPNALYYVMPAGFGNCGSSDAPFCAASSSYTGYLPAYLDVNGEGGTANGNSTSAPVIGSSNGSLMLFDQYQLTKFVESAVTSNSMVWFDNCGYGHIHEESTSGRSKLPPSNFPAGYPTFTYQIKNSSDAPLAFAKNCCTSIYQQVCYDDGNTQVCDLIPPQQIGTDVDDTQYAGSGLHVGAGDTVSYTTLFSDELVEAYRAATGAQLFKLRLMAERSTVTEAGSPVLYDCGDPDAKVTLNGLALEIGSTATSALTCQSGNVQGLCPWPMEAQTGTGKWSGYTLCTLNNSQRSSFVPDLAGWASQQLAADLPVTLMAWGSPGQNGSNEQSGTGGSGGGRGYALTVQTGADLANVPALYAYLGAQRARLQPGGQFNGSGQAAADVCLRRRPREQ